MLALILVGTFIDEKIATFYDFLDNAALDYDFVFFNNNILDGISKLSLMQKMETFFDAIRNILECIFLKNDLEKILFMSFDLFKKFL